MNITAGEVIVFAIENTGFSGLVEIGGECKFRLHGAESFLKRGW